MNRSLALVVLGCLGVIGAACGGSTGPTGPKGDTGAPGASATGAGATPSISGIEPSTAFLARTSHVTISGYGTSWTDATKVDFGAGITVANVHAASPTALVADLTIAKTAALGPRDVVVNDTAKDTYKQAFTVAPPAKLTTHGSLAQGSIAIVDLDLQDLSTPFDTTATSSLFGTTYTNLALTVPAGITSSIQTATNNRVEFLLTVDVDALAGAADLDLLSGPASDPTDIEFPVTGGLTVTARTATALGATAATGDIKTAYDSALYTYTPGGAGAAIVDITASSTATGANPGFALLPKSGHFADLVGFYQASPATSVTTTLLPTSTDPYYAIYWDNTGALGAYTLGAVTTAPAATHATAANDGSKGGAIAATALPFILTGGSFTTATSADWVKVTTGTGDAGKVIHVQTFGDPLTDLSVDIVQSDGTTSIGGDAGGNEPVGPDNVTSSAVTASTTYYVIFAAGTLAFDPADGTYTGLIRLQ